MPSNVQKRNCSKVKKPLSLKGTKKICIPAESQTYNKIIYDAKLFREYLDGMIIKYPEIFP